MMDLADLNIVSIAPTRKTQPDKILRKKKNKKNRQRGKEANSSDTVQLSTTADTVPPHVPANASKAIADEDHAKYLAEFHARPLELDRRSGVRKSKAIVSKTSSHLFVQANDWESLKLHPRIIGAVTSSNKFGLDKPTTIQSHTIQTIQDPRNSQKNVLVHSETGSGKTMAYLLPILQQLAFGKSHFGSKIIGDSTKSTNKPSRKEMGTKCIILCPTRELASQTLTVVEKLCQASFAGWMVPGGLLGGDSRSSEKSRIRKGLAVIVATPGRLLDHLHKTESLLLSLKGKLEWLVLDEADRLLDMGLGDQVRQIVQIVRANEASRSKAWWRSVLVSATVTSSVQSLAKERMLCGDQHWIWVKGGKNDSQNVDTMKRHEVEETKNTESEGLGGGDASSTVQEGYAESTPRQLAQYHITVTAKLRMSSLIAFLLQRVSAGERVVVFMGTCATVDYHHKLFQSMEPLFDSTTNDDTNTTLGLFGDKAEVFKLHGSVQHSKRNQTLKHFGNASKGAILLTTDVSARGLNLEGVDWTVQYDPPCEIADYVHRVGRVARAGKAGHSLLFLLPSERGYLDVLKAKGISDLEPLSVAATLNQAAILCPTWTNAGLKHGGTKEINNASREQSRFQKTSSRQGEYFANEVQYRLEECIVQEDTECKRKWKEQQKEKKKNKQKRGRDSTANKNIEGELLSMARDAFMSFLRAYPTKKEPSVRTIFSARALHLGHIARSFALKEPPKALASKHRQNNQNVTARLEEADRQANQPKALEFSKYENNLVTMSDNEDVNEDDEGPENSRPRKRHKHGFKSHQSDIGRSKNAKALLLANAMKMQNNLMDAM